MKTALFALAVAIFLSGCETAPNVRTSLEPQADPGRFRTYTFVESDPAAKGAIKDAMVRHRLQQMVGRQLAGKGYTPSASGGAELGVHLTGHVEAKQRVYVIGAPGPYNYDWSGREPGGYARVDYREGTLYVDVVDLGARRLLWRAHISEALTPSYSEENWERIERALAEAFKSLPPRR